jgi:predicted RNase H-like HicB family nuclease
MTYGVLFEKMEEDGPAPGWYYAHIPALGLTTHGQCVKGARAAAADLLQVWLEEKRAAGETMDSPSEFLFSTPEFSDDPTSSITSDASERFPL